MNSHLDSHNELEFFILKASFWSSNVQITKKVPRFYFYTNLHSTAQHNDLTWRFSWHLTKQNITNPVVTLAVTNSKYFDKLILNNFLSHQSHCPPISFKYTVFFVRISKNFETFESSLVWVLNQQNVLNIFLLLPFCEYFCPFWPPKPYRLFSLKETCILYFKL